MTTISHQTVRLSTGRHASPQDGMCVMELASVLAGERFTDHPHSVCPLIGGLLRALNDLMDDERRQRLIPLAARVVGTRGGTELERVRVERCREWATQRAANLPWWRRKQRRSARRTAECRGTAHCGEWAGRFACAGDEEMQDSALELVEELAAMSLPRVRGRRSAPQPAGLIGA